MKGAYRKEAPLRIIRGKMLKFLGMSNYYCLEGKVVITMYEFKNNLISKLQLDGNANTPLVQCQS